MQVSIRQTQSAHHMPATPAAVPVLHESPAPAIPAALTTASRAYTVPSAPPPTNLGLLTDAQLYKYCKYYGSQAKGWMRKFESLLPEVYKRRLYKRRGFTGIHEFAQKLAGMSREKVDRILRLSKRIENKPALKQAFESGELGYAKIDEIAFVATPETEAIWVKKAKTLPHIALRLEIEHARQSGNRLKVTDVGNFQPEKMTNGMSDESVASGNEAVLHEPPDVEILNAHVAKVSFNMRPETERKLRALQSELEKARGEAISLGETVEILVSREHEALIEKAQRKKTSNYCPDCVKKRANEAEFKSEVARAVPAEIRHMILARQNYQCAGENTTGWLAREGRTNDESDGVSVRTQSGENNGACAGACSGTCIGALAKTDDCPQVSCARPPTELHHLDGWALTKSHNPDRMRYLCKKHHAETHVDDTHVRAYRSG